LAFNLDNYNIKPGSSADAVAQALDSVYEALSDGVSVADAVQVFSGLTSAFMQLRGKSVSEIKSVVAHAAVALVFDEVAEASVKVV
jgi:hypothetical protein